MDNTIIIADDLTGANDTGVQFCKKGYKTTVIVNHRYFKDIKPNDGVILSVNTDTRGLTAEEAYDRVYGITQRSKKIGFNVFYKKIDSIMRGHPGIEIDGMMDALGFDLAIVAPAFPVNGRIVVNGHLVVRSQSNNAAKDDHLDFNLTADEHPYIPDILRGEMKRGISNIDLLTVREGTQAIINAIHDERKNGKQVMVMDAVTEKDLKTIAEVGKRFYEKAVLVGSAGLAAEIADVIEDPDFTKIEIEENKDGITLLVVGSRNASTALQVEKLYSLSEIPKIEVATDQITSGQTAEVINKYVEEVREYIHSSKPPEIILIVVDSLLNSEEKNPLEYNEEDLMGKAIAGSLGKIIRNIAETEKIKALIVTGGDTSVNVCNALEASGIELMGEIVPGIPIGKLTDGIAGVFPIVTKSGGFGSTDAFIHIIKYLQEHFVHAS